jgi:hypothetical protein
MQVPKVKIVPKKMEEPERVPVRLKIITLMDEVQFLFLREEITEFRQIAEF